jgi:hypothetical protein
MAATKVQQNRLQEDLRDYRRRELIRETFPEAMPFKHQIPKVYPEQMQDGCVKVVYAHTNEGKS